MYYAAPDKNLGGKKMRATRSIAALMCAALIVSLIPSAGISAGGGQKASP